MVQKLAIWNNSLSYYSFIKSLSMLPYRTYVFLAFKRKAAVLPAIGLRLIFQVLIVLFPHWLNAWPHFRRVLALRLWTAFLIHTFVNGIWSVSLSLFIFLCHMLLWLEAVQASVSYKELVAQSPRPVSISSTPFFLCSLSAYKNMYVYGHNFHVCVAEDGKTSHVSECQTGAPFKLDLFHLYWAFPLQYVCILHCQEMYCAI